MITYTTNTSNKLGKTAEWLKESFDSHEEKIDKVLKRMINLE